MSLADSCTTTAPRFGSSSTNPRAASILNASRSGVRDTPNRSHSRRSFRRAPGRSAPSMIICCIFSTTTACRVCVAAAAGLPRAPFTLLRLPRPGAEGADEGHDLVVDRAGGRVDVAQAALGNGLVDHHGGTLPHIACIAGRFDGGQPVMAAVDQIGR